MMLQAISRAVTGLRLAPLEVRASLIVSTQQPTSSSVWVVLGRARVVRFARRVGVVERSADLDMSHSFSACTCEWYPFRAANAARPFHRTCFCGTPFLWASQLRVPRKSADGQQPPDAAFKSVCVGKILTWK